MMDATDPALWEWLAALTIPAAVISGLRLFVLERRERVQRARLETFRGPVRGGLGQSRWEQLGGRFAPMVNVVEQQRLVKMLAAAGIKGRGSLVSLIATKTLTAIAFAVLTWFLLEYRHLFASALMRLPMLGIALIIGWRVPEHILNHIVRRRRSRIEQGIPDALDLLVVCAEAGLSLNQSIEEISRQLRTSHPEIADEFAATSAEMRLHDFTHALDNFVERVGLNNLRGLVATLKQSLQFGTSLAESLRIVASEMRAERNARMEERAARLPVLLALPMMAFILPCLLMIVGTPVVLRIIDTFKNLHFSGISHP